MSKLREAADGREKYALQHNLEQRLVVLDGERKEIDPYADSHLLQQIFEVGSKELAPLINTCALAPYPALDLAQREIIDVIADLAILRLEQGRLEDLNIEDIINRLRVLVNARFGLDKWSGFSLLFLANARIPLTNLFEEESSISDTSYGMFAKIITDRDLENGQVEIATNISDETVAALIGNINDEDFTRLCYVRCHDDEHSALRARYYDAVYKELLKREQAAPADWLDTRITTELLRGNGSEAADYVEQHIDTIADTNPFTMVRLLVAKPELITKRFLEVAETRLKDIVENGSNGNDDRGLTSALTHILGISGASNEADDLLPEYDKQPIREVRERCQKLLKDTIAPHFETIYDVSIAGQIERTAAMYSLPGYYVVNCISSFKSLVEDPEIGPTGIERLEKEFGLTELYRYTPEMLKQQLAEADEDKPYAVVITAQYDHNGAMRDTGVLTKLQKQLQKEGHLLRITEASSRAAVARRLHQLNKRYGNTQKIELLVIDVHGSRDSMAFNGDGFAVGSRMTTGDLASIHERGISSLNETLNSDAKIILGSCSTGKSGGIASEITNTFKRDAIYAPDNDSATSSIDLTFEDGKIADVSVDFSTATTAVFSAESSK